MHLQLLTYASLLGTLHWAGGCGDAGSCDCEPDVVDIVACLEKEGWDRDQVRDAFRADDLRGIVVASESNEDPQRCARNGIMSREVDLEGATSLEIYDGSDVPWILWLKLPGAPMAIKEGTSLQIRFGRADAHYGNYLWNFLIADEEGIVVGIVGGAASSGGFQANLPDEVSIRERVQCRDDCLSRWKLVLDGPEESLEMVPNEPVTLGGYTWLYDGRSTKRESTGDHYDEILIIDPMLAYVRTNGDEQPFDSSSVLHRGTAAACRGLAVGDVCLLHKRDLEPRSGQCATVDGVVYCEPGF